MATVGVEEVEECLEQLSPCQEPFSALSRHNVEIMDTQLVYMMIARRSNVSENNNNFTDVDKVHGPGF